MKFIPYGRQSLDENDIQAVIATLQSDFLTTGPKVKQFEEAIASYVEVKYCVAVSNGTAALHLASLCLLKEGDKVLTTPNSFLATANSILYAKAQPVFVDILDDGNIDLDLCEEMLKKDSSIKAIYVVHFSGKSVNQNKLEYLKKIYNVIILEDAAHALGATESGVKVGSCRNSEISTFSFHPVKHMTTGEGGAITTNSKELYEKLLTLRNHGMQAKPEVAPWHYDMHELGFNYRLTDISCTLGLSQLNKLNDFLEKRKIIAQHYDAIFKNIEGVEPLYTFEKSSAYHLYVVKIDFKRFNTTKKEFVLKMREKNIGLQYHYIPINKQPFYQNLGYGNENLPKMQAYYESAISLPIFPTLLKEDQEYIVKMMKEVLYG